MMTPIEMIRATGACDSSVQWVEARPDCTLAELWDECPRGDWLLWLAVRAGVDRRLVVLAACDCAALALAHVPAREQRPRVAIETARRWARGESTVEEVRAAAGDAEDACFDATPNYSAALAAVAAHSAALVDYDTIDAVDVSCAARDAACAVYAASRLAHEVTLARCADIVRARIDAATIVAALAARTDLIAEPHLDGCGAAPSGERDSTLGAAPPRRSMQR
jgi:hypothetical protein